MGAGQIAEADDTAYGHFIGDIFMNSDLLLIPCQPASPLQRVMTRSATLRRTFACSASQRRDATDWKLLEDRTAAFLEGLFYTGGATSDPAEYQLAEVELKLRKLFAELLGRASAKTNWAKVYRRAAAEVEQAAGERDHELDRAMLAYWRLSAQVWLALWHASDLPNIGVEIATKYLDRAFTPKSESRSMQTISGSLTRQMTPAVNA